MNFRNLSLVVVFLAGIGSIALGGKYNKTLSPGDAAPDWKEVPAIDGKKYSLTDFKDKDILVVVFTCNSCDYAQDVEDRLAALGKKFEKAGNCALIAVCPSPPKVEEDLPEELVKKAKDKGFNFPYLLDPTQKIVRDFGSSGRQNSLFLEKTASWSIKGIWMTAPKGRKSPSIMSKTPLPPHWLEKSRR